MFRISKPWLCAYLHGKWCFKYMSICVLTNCGIICNIWLLCVGFLLLILYFIMFARKPALAIVKTYAYIVKIKRWNISLNSQDKHLCTRKWHMLIHPTSVRLWLAQDISLSLMSGWWFKPLCLREFSFMLPVCLFVYCYFLLWWQMARLTV